MIISADLHIKKYASYTTVDSDGRNSRMMDGIQILQKLCDMAKEDDGVLVIAGDLFDERDFIATESYYLVYQVLRDAKTQGVRVILVLGNHEKLEQFSSMSALYPLESVAEIISEFSIHNINNRAVSFVPWQEDWSGLQTLLSAIRPSEKCVLIGHIPVSGAVLGASNYRLREGGVSAEDVCSNAYQHVILGHYHKAQTLSNNIHYVGSPLQLTFGETGDEKRVLKLDMVSLQLQSIPVTDAPKFYEGVYQDKQVFIDTEESCAHGFLRVYCKTEDNLSDVQKAIEDVSAVHRFRSVRIERLAAEKKHEDRLAITENVSDIEVIKKYIDYVPSALDKSMLYQLGEKMIDGESAEEFCAKICNI